MDNYTGILVSRGFTSASGIYVSPSYKNIPSHVFKTKQDVWDEKDAVVFTQVTGARTVSPEVLGKSYGGKVGKVIGALAYAPLGPVVIVGGFIGGGVVGGTVGEITAHQVKGFPPIWSKIQIRIYNDGRTETLLLQHSWFPSLTWYSQRFDAMGKPEETFVRVNHPSGQAFYNATKDVHYDKWNNLGWGHLEGKTTPGPTGGNPWGITKGVF